jgi:hypothetical protein
MNQDQLGGCIHILPLILVRIIQDQLKEAILRLCFSSV